MNGKQNAAVFDPAFVRQTTSMGAQPFPPIVMVSGLAISSSLLIWDDWMGTLSATQIFAEAISGYMDGIADIMNRVVLTRAASHPPVPEPGKMITGL
jgi:hypothetical protein